MSSSTICFSIKLLPYIYNCCKGTANEWNDKTKTKIFVLTFPPIASAKVPLSVNVTSRSDAFADVTNNSSNFIIGSARVEKKSSYWFDIRIYFTKAYLGIV